MLWLEIDEKIQVAGIPRDARGLRTEDPHSHYPVGLGNPPDVRDPLAQNTFRHATPEARARGLLVLPSSHLALVGLRKNYSTNRLLLSTDTYLQPSFPASLPPRLAALGLCSPCPPISLSSASYCPHCCWDGTLSATGNRKPTEAGPSPITTRPVAPTSRSTGITFVSGLRNKLLKNQRPSLSRTFHRREIHRNLRSGAAGIWRQERVNKVASLRNSRLRASPMTRTPHHPLQAALPLL